MTPTYAQVADFEAYVGPSWTTTNPTALEHELEAAEVDVEFAVGHVPTDEATGRKFDVGPNTALTAPQLTALQRAVCAQAEYRLRMGRDFMVRSQHAAVSGPRFSTTGQLDYIGPAVWRELAGAGLTKLTASVGSRSSWPPWWPFAVNVEDDDPTG